MTTVKALIPAERSRAAKTLLRARFPGVRFSVRIWRHTLFPNDSDLYLPNEKWAGVYVVWWDGPPREEVQRICQTEVDERPTTWLFYRVDESAL